MQQGYYAVIPATVRYSRDVSDGAKLLYGEITALCDKSGFCWAANSYFAELYDCSERTISRWISELAQAGFILTLVDNERGNSRKIWLTESQGGIDKNVHRVTTKMSQGSRQKCREGIDKNVYNNTTVEKKERKKEKREENSNLEAEEKPFPQVPPAPLSAPPGDGLPTIEAIAAESDTLHQTYLISRRLPAERFAEFVLSFDLEQATATTHHHGRRDKINHFFNFCRNRIEIEKAEAAGPATVRQNGQAHQQPAARTSNISKLPTYGS